MEKSGEFGEVVVLVGGDMVGVIVWALLLGGGWLCLGVQATVCWWGQRIGWGSLFVARLVMRWLGGFFWLFDRRVGAFLVVDCEVWGREGGWARDFTFTCVFINPMIHRMERATYLACHL